MGDFYLGQSKKEFVEKIRDAVQELNENKVNLDYLQE
jgi:hypothetical protein